MIFIILGEDDDMYERLASSNLKLIRPLSIFGRYKMIKHTDQKSNPDRFKKLKGANKRYKNDGVNQINYILVNTTLYEGLTHFYFDICLSFWCDIFEKMENYFNTTKGRG